MMRHEHTRDTDGEVDPTSPVVLRLTLRAMAWLVSILGAIAGTITLLVVGKLDSAVTAINGLTATVGSLSTKLDGTDELVRMEREERKAADLDIINRLAAVRAEALKAEEAPRARRRLAVINH